MYIDYSNFMNLPQKEVAKSLLEDFKDENIRCALEKLIYIDVPKKVLKINFSHYFKSFIYLSINLKNVSKNDDFWIVLCDLYNNCNDKKVKSCCGGLCLKLIFIIMEDGHYIGKYRNKLEEVKDSFFLKRGITGIRADILLCGENIEYLYFSNKKKYKKYIFLKLATSFLRNICLEFYEDVPFASKKFIAREFIFSNAGKLFGDYVNTITKLSDIDYDFFYFVQQKLIKEDNAEELIAFWNRFFIFLLDHESGEGRNIFKDGDPICVEALMYNEYPKLICDGFELIFYNPLCDIPKAERWILCFNNFAKYSLSKNMSNCNKFDFLKISDVTYRNIVKEYIWKSNLGIQSILRRFRHYVEILNKLKKIKAITKIPANHITLKEIDLILRYVNTRNIGEKEVLFYDFKRIIQFGESKGKLIVEENGFYGIRVEIGKKLGVARAIPNEDMERLNEYMFKNSSKSLENFYCYVIFHLAYQSEFRISQICNLKAGCISHIKEDHNLISVSKTSNGEFYEATVTDFFKDLIIDVEKVSSKLREECFSKECKDYLFLYKNNCGYYFHLNYEYFNRYLKKCCEILGLPHYNSGNIRDTHMTKAQEFRLRTNISDATMKVLTGHKSIDTSVNYYIEDNLRERLIYMSDKIIGDIEIDGTIVDVMPDSLRDKKHNVEYGCGSCTLECCEDDVFYNCLACKHFCTTVDMLPRFEGRKKQLENLYSTDCESEDLRARLELIEQWISAIKKKMEE